MAERREEETFAILQIRKVCNYSFVAITSLNQNIRLWVEKKSSTRLVEANKRTSGVLSGGWNLPSLFF